jgi:molybdopterin-guanine dinucleotide biosynthesis protein A
MIKRAEIAGFVLAGGRSRRMGRDKALLELNGRSLLSRAVELLRPYVAEVVLLGPRSRYSDLGMPIVEDSFAGEGPLVGIASGLRSTNCDWNIFLACDMPLVRVDMLEAVVQRVSAGSGQAVVPRATNTWQPLCAAYHRSCLPMMEQAIAKERMATVKVLPLLRVESILVAASDEEMFRSVNTAEDWKQIQGIAGVCAT